MMRDIIFFWYSLSLDTYIATKKKKKNYYYTMEDVNSLNGNEG